MPWKSGDSLLPLCSTKWEHDEQAVLCNLEDGPHQNSTMLPWRSWTSQPSELWEINFYCLWTSGSYCLWLILFINLWYFIVAVVVQSLSWVWLFATPWTAALQASLSLTISRSLLKLMSIELVMPCNHFVLCHPFSSFLNLSQHQGLFQWVSSSHQVAKVL